MEDIDKLLDKYFEGETSLQEEKVLRSYFLGTKIEERHKVFKPMFNFFSEEKNETSTQKRHTYPVRMWIGIAASILLLAGIWSLFSLPVEKENKSLVYVNGKEITDAKIINAQILNSIENISEIDEDAINTQIGILDSFTE